MLLSDEAIEKCTNAVSRNVSELILSPTYHHYQKAWGICFLFFVYVQPELSYNLVFGGKQRFENKLKLLICSTRLSPLTSAVGTEVVKQTVKLKDQ